MDGIINFLYWWNENIYLLKIIENMDNKLHSIILVMFILFLYPIPWAIVLTWIRQLKISYIFRFWIILSLTLLIAIADLLMIIVYAPFIVFHLILYRKEKITKRMLLISIALIMLTQIKIPFDYYTYYLKCNHNEFYEIELIDNELSIKELEWDKDLKNNTFPVYSEYDKSKSSLFGLKHYNLHLVKDDRVVAKKIVPVVVNGWLDRMLGNFFGNHFENRKYCYMNNYNQKLITKLKELISKKIENRLDNIELATYKEHFTYYNWRDGKSYIKPYDGFNDCYDMTSEYKCLVFIENVIANVQEKAETLKKIKNL